MLDVAKPTESYEQTVERLSRASVSKHFDAYEDIAWESADYAIDPRDPRWERNEDDLLGATEWYQSQPQQTRARIGLDLTACQMKMGIEFENILSRGLLEFAATRPNGSAEYRYAYHELIEEGQHSLMFQEFVNRSGFDAPRLSPWMQHVTRMVPRLGRVFPELFFVHVLAGELPIDYLQRRELRHGAVMHPLLRRIMQIHVTEEARHVCFARRYLESQLASLSPVRRLQLRMITPFVLQQTAGLMLRPPAFVLRHHRVPKRVVAEAYGSGPRYRALACDGLQPLRELCVEFGVVTPRYAPLWRALGISPGNSSAKALPSGKPERLGQ
jgi:hypothetical protein